MISGRYGKHVLYNKKSYMRSLASCLHEIIRDGYVEIFNVTERGLLRSATDGRDYPPETVEVLNFYHFEGSETHRDNMILYVIETAEGAKGTLVTGWGGRREALVEQFILEAMHSKDQMAHTGG